MPVTKKRARKAPQKDVASQATPFSRLPRPENRSRAQLGLKPPKPKPIRPECVQGLTAEQVAQLLGVGVSSVWRWTKSGRWPAMVIRLLSIVRLGDLGALNPEWRGWRMAERGVLTCCDLPSEEWTPGNLMAIPFQRALIGSYQREALYRRGLLPKYSASGEVAPRDPQDARQAAQVALANQERQATEKRARAELMPVRKAG